MTMPKLLVGYASLVVAFFGVLLNPSPLSSANLTSVKDTLQSSRLSWSSRVESTGTASGNSHVQIQAAPATPYNATSTNNLRAGDSITINANSYTIIDIIDADEFTVNPVVVSGDEVDGSPIQMRVKPRHVITFTTASAVANGSFRILLPADGTTPNDGNIDDEGYDFNTTVDVTASNVTGYTFGTGTSTAYGGVNCTAPTNYHCFDIGYTGSGAIGTTITINIGNTDGSNSLISPTEVASHTEGTADTYTVLVRNYASGADPDAVDPVDSTSAKVAHIEAVRVTATVDPTINLTIAGVASGQTRCGLTTDVTTTALSVPFGAMALNTFKTLAQDITVNTNASGGYVVTAVENDQLGKDGGTSPNIADATGEDTLASHTAIDDWEVATFNGFGYSLDNDDAAVIPFEYSTTSGNCSDASGFCAKHFAAAIESEDPQTIFSSTTVANAENIAVCYRLSVGATQAAGDYENQITYTATGTF